jgi:hypothetical protein
MREAGVTLGLVDAGTPLADPSALRLPVGRNSPEPTPEPQLVVEALLLSQGIGDVGASSHGLSSFASVALRRAWLPPTTEPDRRAWAMSHGPRR